MSELIAVIVGGALTFSGSFAAKMVENRREVRALRSALKAEINGLLAIADLRHHEEKAENILACWKAGTDVALVYFGSEYAHNDAIYQSNVDKIGLLGHKLAAKIVDFYTKLLAVRITVRAFEENKINNQPLSFRINQIEEALIIWKSAKQAGLSIISEL